MFAKRVIPFGMALGIIRGFAALCLDFVFVFLYMAGVVASFFLFLRGSVPEGRPDDLSLSRVQAAWLRLASQLVGWKLKLESPNDG